MSPVQFAWKLVVVARSDLRLSAGKTAVQVAHAAVSCALASKKRDPDTFREWYDEGQRKVVVKVPNLRALYELKAQAEDLGLVTSLIQDAGLTEIPAGTVTVLGIGPAKERDIDRVTGNLSLL
ncbi:MAG: peptidyl-tRNA hydrolase [Euryarchaeota archaeon]|nr:peptidyl-tRNA hydrolase [Euryarchaeota archaeon]